ncbi:MAG: CBS domain-containing protein [Cyclobacteriaceae bacterium]|nr:CBS domain-containing protein [Cyclobacteriaceae bacterium]
MNYLILNENTTLNEAVRLLDNNGNGFLPVVDSDQRLKGIITDGDLRRGILNKTLDLHSIINSKPVVEKQGTPHSAIRRKLRELRKRHMPVVSEDGRLIEVVFIENLSVEKRPNTVVIMSGGLGSRLGSLTSDTPKPMLPVMGKPILEHIIENFKLQGFSNFVLCLNHKASVIQDYFKNGEQWGVSISYTLESKRLGTAGALSLLNLQSISTSMIVVNGDILTNLDFSEALSFHTTANADATMCVRPQAFEVPYACVEFDQHMVLTGLVEKPKMDHFVNAGIYILNPSVIKLVPKDEFYDMPTLFQDLLKEKRRAVVYRFEDYWIDIGQPVDYAKANREITS